MYDDLVKRLRVACMNCKLWDSIHCCINGPCDGLISIEAADAIEELQEKLITTETDLSDFKEAMAWKEHFDILTEQDCKPHWIPVTERLPEEYKDVLCYYEYFRYGDYNCMFRTIDIGYYGDGRWGGEAGQGHKNKVLAWMPLPEPPEKESES